MTFKDYLMSLTWRSFVKYPEQGDTIYIHCFTDDGCHHKFAKVNFFNAVSLDFQKIVQKTPNNHKWQFSWLPAKPIEENYDKSTAD